MSKSLIISNFVYNFQKYSPKYGALTLLRPLTLSCTVRGKRSREPYDKRWGIHPKDVNKKGGTRELALKLGKATGMPQLPGFYDKRGSFHIVPEMIPEFVVPDLKDFKLKPYVSYRAPDVKQSAFTAQDLFDATYAKELVKDFNDGKLDAAAIDERLQKLKAIANQ